MSNHFSLLYVKINFEMGTTVKKFISFRRREGPTGPTRNVIDFSDFSASVPFPLYRWPVEA
jgi:hypothetical protein